jgi:hypothetical protein
VTESVEPTITIPTYPVVVVFLDMDLVVVLT